MTVKKLKALLDGFDDDLLVFFGWDWDVHTPMDAIPGKVVYVEADDKYRLAEPLEPEDEAIDAVVIS